GKVADVADLAEGDPEEEDRDGNSDDPAPAPAAPRRGGVVDGPRSLRRKGGLRAFRRGWGHRGRRLAHVRSAVSRRRRESPPRAISPAPISVTSSHWTAW